MARRPCPVAQVVVAAPACLADHPCLGYAYRARSDVWRFTNAAGEEVVIKPEGPLRVTNADALLPTVLAGLAIAEFPEFIAADHVRAGQPVPILEDWHLARDGLYFVTPSARTRPAKVEALSDFFIKHLGSPDWRFSLDAELIPRQFLRGTNAKKCLIGDWQRDAAECNFYSFSSVKFCPLRAIPNKTVRAA